MLKPKNFPKCFFKSFCAKEILQGSLIYKNRLKNKKAKGLWMWPGQRAWPTLLQALVLFFPLPPILPCASKAASKEQLSLGSRAENLVCI
jgi:hypothetical protein